MKTNLLINCMLMCIAWSLYLSRMIVAAILMCILATVLMAMKLRHIRLKRMGVVYTLSCIFFIAASLFSTISSFFDGFMLFGFFASLNITVMNEMLNKKSGNLNQIHSVFSLVMLVFFMSAVLLPDSWYTVFTKANLYTLVACIFVPYEAVLASVLLYKENRIREAVLN